MLQKVGSRTPIKENILIPKGVVGLSIQKCMFMFYPIAAFGFFNFMNFLEKSLENIIFETSNDKLISKGLFISGTKKRQLRIGNYGICDLITHNRVDGVFGGDSYHKIQIFELKRDIIDEKAFFQALRYAKGLQRYFEHRNSSFYVDMCIVLVGSRIDLNTSIIYLPDFNDYNSSSLPVFLYTYKYDFDGISFELHKGYSLINEGFK